MREIRNLLTILVGMPQRQLWGPRLRWKDAIKMEGKGKVPDLN
jgi:hypothetical protein